MQRFLLASTVAIIAGGFALMPLDAVAESPKAQPSAEPTEGTESPAKAKPISLDDYLAGISGASAEEQAAFAEKHAGTNVTWVGYVRAINKNMSPDGAFYQLILNAKPAAEEGTPIGLFVAQFDGSAEKQLMALEVNQKATVSGKLVVGANPAVPTVADAKLSGS